MKTSILLLALLVSVPLLAGTAAAIPTPPAPQADAGDRTCFGVGHQQYADVDWDYLAAHVHKHYESLCEE
jgi:hypothetical protein